ncbi:MAG: Maf family protein [Oligoflexia bacterium]|nr:Maf family protein [Oligoflexia bacterium]
MGTKNWRLILASASPQRLKILKDAGFECTTFPSNSSESFNENLTLNENLSAISREKIITILPKLSIRKQKGILILGADTVVVLRKKVFGKPENEADARRMLSALSGKTHEVKTAFSIFCPDQTRGVTRVVTSLVKFRRLSEKEIKCYIESKEPFGKAGSYAIQGKAKEFVKYVDGDFLNVVGLPLAEFKSELRRQRWNVRVRKQNKKSSRKNR